MLRAGYFSAALLPLTVLWQLGCVRGGFSVPTDAKQPPADGRARVDTGASHGHGDAAEHDTSVDGPGKLVLDQRHDVCTAALPTTAPASVVLDFSAARDDYRILCCFGAPELVLRATAAAAAVLSCTGGGDIAVMHSTACPPSLSGGCYRGRCAAGNSVTMDLAVDDYIYICRPASDGPATLQIAAR